MTEAPPLPKIGPVGRCRCNLCGSLKTSGRIGDLCSTCSTRLEVKLDSRNRPEKPSNSKDTSTALLIIEHYKRNGVAAGWDTARAQRLANMLGITIWELGRLTAFFGSRKEDRHNHHLVTQALVADHFPPCVSLHFAFLEAWAIRVIARRNGHLVPLQEEVMPLNLLL